MTPTTVRAQLADVIDRLILTSLSVKQFHPSVRVDREGKTMIGRPGSNSTALKDLSYEDVYSDIEGNDSYDVKLVDGGLLVFQYKFDATPSLLRHRLAYFPNPALPTLEEAPGLYEDDELYGDILAKRLVRFPIRFDYDPGSFIDGLHPSSHLTLGQYSDCRIPVAGPIGPSAFMGFIVRNFYFRAYRRHKNKFDRSPPALERIETISATEKRLCHFVHAG